MHRLTRKRPTRSRIRLFRALSVLVSSTVIISCEPEVGSADWCVAMRDKPKQEWLGQEVKDYFRYCIGGEAASGN